ncbi:MAG: hypothetical protein FK732_01825 [Asgard group archaeon]|nr:hypothetical protein [Asgard group archaeon]
MVDKKKEVKDKEVTEEAVEIEDLISLEEETLEHKGLWSIIKLPWYEFLIIGLLLAATITMFILNGRLGTTGTLIGLVITASLMGLWLAFRPSEWAVDGLDNIMRTIGLTAYVAGVISSLASNLPEAVAAGIMLIKGQFFTADAAVGHDLVVTAFYTTLAAAGFNAILLGIVVLVGGKKKGYIEVQKTTIMAEGVLLRWGFIATLLTFGVAVVEFINSIIDKLNAGEFPLAEGTTLTGDLPQMAGIALVVSYLIYLVYLIVKSREAKALEEYDVVERSTKPTRSKLDEKMPEMEKIAEKVEITEHAHRKILDTPEEINIIDPTCPDTKEVYTGGTKTIFNPFLDAPTMEHPHLTMRTAIVLVVLGIAGIAGGGFLMSSAVEMVLHETHIHVGLMALIVGFAGAVPEHGIAVVAAAKGKTDIALGNILGGILQMTLLIFGIFASIVSAPIDGFMLFQIIALAGILWFVKRSMSDDHRITSFEGIMIILAQLFAFLLLVGEFTGLTIF